MSFDGSAFIRHVAERLIQEFEFSRGAGTPGLIGAAKEHPARVQLQRLMPGGVGVGSGIVVDSFGGASRQQDIVIYETLCPVFTHNDAPEATYFPVEGVIAVGEVKSGFSKQELQDAVRKSASVKTLRRRAEPTQDGLGPPAVSYRNYGSATCFAATEKNQFDQGSKSLDQVCSFVLCQKFLASSQVTLENFAQQGREAGVAMMPNVLISLEDGGIFPFNSESNSLTRAAIDGDGAIFSPDPVAGFAHLVAMLRLYAVSGRTVDRNHFEKYFRAIGTDAPTFPVYARVAF